jgi:hypothetical protein
MTPLELDREDPSETLGLAPCLENQKGGIMMEITIAALNFVSSAVFLGHAYDAAQKD